MIIAFFDFDGTITKKDSFLDFVSFTEGSFKMYKGVLVHLIPILGYKLGLISGHQIKEKLLTYFYKGRSENILTELGMQYSNTRLPNIIRPKAIDRIKWHKDQGHEVVVVTASILQWIKPWCDQLNIKYITTEIDVVNELITGKLKGENCIGPEKVVRIEKEYNIKSLEYIYAYGNSKGDRGLLEIANEKYYCFF